MQTTEYNIGARSTKRWMYVWFCLWTRPTYGQHRRARSKMNTLSSLNLSHTLYPAGTHAGPSVSHRAQATRNSAPASPASQATAPGRRTLFVPFSTIPPVLWAHIALTCATTSSSVIPQGSHIASTHFAVHTPPAQPAGAPTRCTSSPSCG